MIPRENEREIAQNGKAIGTSQYAPWRNAGGEGGPLCYLGDRAESK